MSRAIHLFAERGIANTTVAQIAHAAGVTAAMVHYWFDTRDKLLDAVVQERVAPIIREIWEPAAASSQSVVDIVRGLVGRMLDVSEKNPWLPALWLREIVQQGGLLRERAFARIPQERYAAFRRSIARAQTKGEISSDIVPDLLFFSIAGLVLLPGAGGQPPPHIDSALLRDRRILERHVIALIMHGLVGRSPSPARRSARAAK